MPELLPAIWLGMASLAIGAMVGATGIGGFLIIPALVFFSDMPLRMAMGTPLPLAAANGALGAWLFLRRGNIDWRIATPMAAGSIAFALGGGWLNRWLPVPLLVGMLACIMIAGSAASFRRHSMPQQRPANAHVDSRPASLTAIGCLSGLAAGLTGAGGPLVSVPLLNILGYPVLIAVGASQVLQFVASLSGAIPYWQSGLIATGALIVLMPMQLLGIWTGVRLVHAIDQRLATRAVAVLGMAAGAGILALAVK